MSVSTTPAISAVSTVVSVRHWHVTESDAGYLPESEPYTTDDAESALDDLAHRLAGWADTFDDPEAVDGLYAAGMAEIYCTCREGARSAEHHDAVASVEGGGGCASRSAAGSSSWRRVRKRTA